MNQQFIDYCRTLGILKEQEFFYKQNNLDKNGQLHQMLFIHLLSLNRDGLMQLASRIVNVFQSYRIKSQNDIDLFDRLHKESYKVKESQLINEQIKQEFYFFEIKDCTFKPQISKTSNDVLENSFRAPVYERLSKLDNKMKQRIYEEQKYKQEVVGCTFQPNVNNYEKDSVFRQQQDVHQKLYLDAENQRNKQDIAKRIRDNSQEYECSFKPQISAQKESDYFSEPVGDRLYRNFMDRMQNNFVQQAQQQIEELGQCTFTPNVNDKKHRQDQVVYERLYNLSKQKNQDQNESQSMSSFKNQVNAQSEKLIQENRSQQKRDHRYITSFSKDQSVYDRLYLTHKRKGRSNSKESQTSYQSNQKQRKMKLGNIKKENESCQQFPIQEIINTVWRKSPTLSQRMSSIKM